MSLNNPAHCSRAFYRLSQHNFFREWIGVLVPGPRPSYDGTREKFLLIEVSRPQEIQMGEAEHGREAEQDSGWW